jgi:hypothetical protein
MVQFRTMILVLCPSRGRPENAARLIASWHATVTGPNARLLIGVDEDDPTRQAYLDVAEQAAGLRKFGFGDVRAVTLWGADTGDLTRALNSMWVRYASDSDIVGTVNDDMVFKTPGWDEVIGEGGASIVFGDDGFQHDALVTSPFMAAWVPQTLGWFALPTLHHQFIDNVWGDIGRGIDSLRYLPGVSIEHLHPFASKADWDETYERGNAQAIIDIDRQAYEDWRDNGGRDADIARLRAAR